jgi:hypothetical protein
MLKTHVPRHEDLALAVADSQRWGASAVSTDGLRDLKFQSMRLLVAAGLAMILLSARLAIDSSLAIDWWDGLGDDERTMAMSASRRHFG